MNWVVIVLFFFIMILRTYGDYPFYKYFSGPFESNGVKSCNYLCVRGPVGYSCFLGKRVFNRSKLIPLEKKDMEKGDVGALLDKVHEGNVKEVERGVDDMVVESPEVHIESVPLLSPQQELLRLINVERRLPGEGSVLMPFELPYQRGGEMFSLPAKSLYERK